MMLFTLLALSKDSIWIGPRTYCIEDDGLRQVTDSSSLIHIWKSIREVIVSGRMMMVRLDSFQFFLMPERGFKDPSKYEEFCAMVEKRWRAAA